MHRRKGKPEESKTVRQWGLLGRIPIDALKPSYIWETQTDGPVTVYYHEENTREMTESEEAAFLADIKGVRPAVLADDNSRKSAVTERR